MGLRGLLFLLRVAAHRGKAAELIDAGGIGLQKVCILGIEPQFLIEVLLQIRNKRSLIHDTENCIHVDFGQYPLQCFVAICILQRGNKIKVVDFFAIDLNAGKRD